MLRRGNSGSDALPTHGGSSGGFTSSASSSRGYGGYGGYGGYDQKRPSSGGIGSVGSGGMYGESSKYNKKKKSSFPLLAILLVGLGLADVTLTLLWLNARGSYNSFLKELGARNSRDAIESMLIAEREVDGARRESRRETRRVQGSHDKRVGELRRENRDFRKQRDDLREKYESPQKQKDGTRLKQRELAFLEQIELLQNAIRKESTRTVLERFGPGPHEVQLTFKYEEVDYDFVIEMAPLKTVPHAIHLFLEQVEHGLLSKSFFYLDSAHVIQGGPKVSREEEAAAHAEGKEWERTGANPYKDLGLDSLAFPDYSDEFSHQKWTVGFAGRPGGLDFYINKEDNSEAHGPGGQVQHALDEQGDACFGRITKGQQHIQNILFNHLRYNDGSDWNDFYIDAVPIVGAKILTPRPAAGTPVNLENIPEAFHKELGKSIEEMIARIDQQEAASVEAATS